MAARLIAGSRLAIISVCAIALQSVNAGWTLSRTTYYGAPEAVAKAYDPSRGQGSFGIVAYGSCGFTDLPGGNLPFPRESYAALADAAPDYPGSCGRCYEVRCKSGPTLDNKGSPIKVSASSSPRATPGTLYFEGDVFRPYLASINPNVTDEQGRRYPGNPTEAQGTNTVKCYDESKIVRVRISDSCPCTQVLPPGAPGVKPGGETRRQEWCCGPMKHFDLSYWAFEQLAHPVNGAIMIESRPVDCVSGRPLPDNFISGVVYSFRGIEPGWSWLPTKAVYAKLQVSGAGIAGGTATCVRLARGGDVSFRSREAKPFIGRNTLNFWINAAAPIKVFLMIDAGGRQQYCFEELFLTTGRNSTSRFIAGQQGRWTKYAVPLGTFRCEGALDPTQLNRIDFQNVSGEETEFCLTGVELS